MNEKQKEFNLGEILNSRRMLLLIFFVVIVTSFSGQIYAQNKVAGNVKDVDGNPIPGVSVIVKGTTIGAISNVDGNYEVAPSSMDATLVFSFVGMETKEIAINGQSSINVVLSSSNLQLEETVVIAYGTKKKRDVIGSVTKVDGTKFANSATGSFEHSLQGRAAGVQVSNRSGLPGQTPKIKVRGISSINSGRTFVDN